MTDTRTTRRCMSCLLVGTHSRTCPDLYVYDLYAPPVVPGPEAYRLEDTYVISREVPPPAPLHDTLAGGLSWTGVMQAVREAPQSHRAGRNRRGPIPVWPVVLVFCGLVLMALAMVAYSLAVPLHEAITR